MKALLIYGSVILFSWWLLFCTHLTFNVTGSLPYHGFFCVRGMKVQKGDLVCLKGHETAYTPGISFTKRLGGGSQGIKLRSEKIMSLWLDKMLDGFKNGPKTGTFSHH